MNVLNTFIVDTQIDICKQVERMIGKPPIGLIDTLKILCHPDVIDKTEKLVKLCKHGLEA